jgi:hypothetical protein
MNATEFTKAKVHFTLALLGALFALHPFYDKFNEISFAYMGNDIPVSYALMAVGVFLAGAVYFYATELMTDHPSPLSQRLGNYLYALAVMTVPFYGGMWGSTLVENYLIDKGIFAEYGINTPVITISILVGWLLVWQGGGILLRRYLTKRDWVSKIDMLTDKEMNALKRGRELMDAGHADAAIVQFHKAVMARLKMACLKQGYFSDRTVNNAMRARIIHAQNKPFLDIVQKHFAVAESTTPVEEGAVNETSVATKKLLATIAV